MADGRKTHQGLPSGHHHNQSECLNWAECDMFEQDLLDLDEADSELLDNKLLQISEFPEDAKGDLFQDVNINQQSPQDGQVSLDQVDSTHELVSREATGNVLSESPMDRSPKYPPTLLELQVQALAKLGLIKLYYDSKDLEMELAKAEEDRKKAIVDKYERDRQALSPVPDQEPQLVNRAVSSATQTSGGANLLELQKAALLSMKGMQMPSIASTSTLPPVPLTEGSDLLELQKVALSSMIKTAQPIAPPPTAEWDQNSTQSSGPTIGSLRSNVEVGLMELQKVAWMSMKKLSEVIESHTPFVSRPMPQSNARGDLLQLQQLDQAANISPKYQSEPSPQTIAPTKMLQQDIASDLLELQKVALRSMRTMSESLELQKSAPKSGLYQGAPVASPPAMQQTMEDFLELQKLALRNIQTQATLSSTTDPQAERELGFQDLPITNLSTMSRKIPPTHIGQQEGGGVSLKPHKEASSGMSYGKEGGKQVTPRDKDGKQQFKGEGGEGTSSSSLPMFKEISVEEPLEKLLQELSLKDKALHFANRTIEEKDQRLQEYEASLANALNLLQCMNVRYTDSQDETSKVLTEVEEIFGNLNEACIAVEYFDCSIPQCAKKIHNLEEPEKAAQTAPNSTDLVLCTKNYELGTNVETNQVDELRNLVEELLRELSSIEVARKEAQLGFQLQIQRNEQLIAELQLLDIASPALEGASCDRDQHLSDQGKENRSEDTLRNSSDQGKQNVHDQAEKDPFDQAKGYLGDNFNKSASDQAGQISSALVSGNQQDKIVADQWNDTKEIQCDHVYESPSNEAKQTICDHVFEPSFVQLGENSCDHECTQPGDQSDEKYCDHVYVSDPQDHFHESQCDFSDESTHDQTNKNQCDHSYEPTSTYDQTNENLCDHSYEPTSTHDRTNKNPCDHSYEPTSTHDQTNKNPSDHSYEPTNENRCDHEFETSYDLDSEVHTELFFDCPHDLPCEDDKNSKPELQDKEIESPHHSAIDTLKEVESKALVEIQSAEHARPQPKRPNCVTRLSSPNALWDHLRHFEKQHGQLSEEKMPESITQNNKPQGDLYLNTKELETQLEHRANEISVLHKQMKEMREALLLEQEERKRLSRKAIDIHPWPTIADIEQKDKVIRKMHFQMHQLESALQQEREANRETLIQRINESTCDATLNKPTITEMDNLKASLHSKEEHIRKLDDKIARKETIWQAEKHQMMKCIDDLETKLLVKEEEVINLSHELETSRSAAYSQRPDELRFEGDNHTHFFNKMEKEKEEGREILNLRCEVLSLQDCLGIKTQAIKTMEKELARSYSIVTELRSKLRSLQEYEQNAPKKGYKDLIGKLKSTEEKLQKSESERALMNRKIQDLSTKCKYFEELEHLHKEGFDDKKKQVIKDLEKELERNVQLIKNLQARCNEYEARAKRAESRNNFDLVGRPSEGGRNNSQEWDHTKLVQLSKEKEALRAECDKLRLEMVHYQEESKRKDNLVDELQCTLQNLKKKQISFSPGVHKQNNNATDSTMVLDDEGKGGRPKNEMPISQSANPLWDPSKVESQDINTLREMLRGQWRVHKVMEDRLNTMMAYVTDRVNEFEREPSDVASDSSLAATPELNHFHVEAKLMKLQLEQQLQVLRGTTLSSLPTSGVASPGQLPQTGVSTDNFQLLVEKTALEDSAQTLQEKTSRLLNKLTFMRTEFNSH